MLTFVVLNNCLVIPSLKFHGKKQPHVNDIHVLCISNSLWFLRFSWVKRAGLNQSDFVFYATLLWARISAIFAFSGQKLFRTTCSFPKIAIKSSFYDDKNMCLLISGRKSPHF